MLSRRFLQSLHARHDWHGGPLRRLGAAAKYLLRSRRVRAQHAAWLDFLADTWPMPVVVARDARLFERYQHRYINTGFDLARRLAIVHGHYRFIHRYWPPALIAGVYLDRSMTIGRLALRDGSGVNIVLKAPPIKGLEGELGIYLCDDAGNHLSSLILTLADDGDTLLIGCVQGAVAGAGKEAVRELTRQCHGLRPKNLLLSLAYAIVESYGIARIRGVGQAVHPFAHRQDKIKSDYNGFWLESGGSESDDGMFDLPAREPLRDVATVDSKHRSAFRRREALRGEAVEILQLALGRPAVRDRVAA
jgi:uncharacterized protein VirK/YbjX